MIAGHARRRLASQRPRNFGVIVDRTTRPAEQEGMDDFVLF
jgi:hypothetical protein